MADGGFEMRLRRLWIAGLEEGFPERGVEVVAGRRNRLGLRKEVGGLVGQSLIGRDERQISVHHRVFRFVLDGLQKQAQCVAAVVAGIGVDGAVECAAFRRIGCRRRWPQTQRGFDLPAVRQEGGERRVDLRAHLRLSDALHAGRMTQPAARRCLRRQFAQAATALDIGPDRPVVTGQRQARGRIGHAEQADVRRLHGGGDVQHARVGADEQVALRERGGAVQQIELADEAPGAGRMDAQLLQ